MLDSALFATLHGEETVQPGPLKITTARFGSKLPVIVNVNACAARGGFGDVPIMLI